MPEGDYAGDVTAAEAWQGLAENPHAVLVDVRTVGEFSSGNLPGAINIPLDSLQSGIEAKVSDRSDVILLHCRSGRRSGIAENELRAMGYTNAFNIGGFADAEAIVKAASAQSTTE